jgi:hypothetical protein
MTLPSQYVSCFAGDGLKEGALAVAPGWFQLWSPDEVEHWNQEYKVQEFAPGFLALDRVAVVNCWLLMKMAKLL